MAGVRRTTDLVRRLVSRQRAPTGKLLQWTAPIHAATQSSGSPFLRSDRDSAPAARVFHALNTRIGVRHLHLDSGLGVPVLTDPQAMEALNALMATNWAHIPQEVRDQVKAALPKEVADVGVLSAAWSSAQASEKFAETLISLRMDLDELSGGSGESVGELPETLAQALESAFRKYTAYLDAIGEDEDYLSKKVENDIGSLLVQLKQRCGGLDAKWGKITLLGTSGISGSYIELRSTP